MQSSNVQRGREYISDEFSEGRTATTISMLDQDERVIYKQIRATLGIGMNAIQQIFHVCIFNRWECMHSMDFTSLQHR